MDGLDEVIHVGDLVQEYGMGVGRVVQVLV